MLKFCQLSKCSCIDDDEASVLKADGYALAVWGVRNTARGLLETPNLQCLVALA